MTHFSPSAFAGFFGALFFVTVAVAAPPKIDAVFPAGGKIGTEVDVVFVGKVDPWPCEFHATDPGLKFVPDKEKERVGKMVISGSMKPGPVWFRFYDGEGASEPRLFFVGTLPEIVESKEGDHQSVGAGQKVDQPLPLVVNGRLEKRNEADFFNVSLKKGQTLHAGIDGYSLRSPIDPMLHVYDSDGARLALQHDGPVNLDPRLRFTAPKDGDFTVGVLAIGHPANANVHFMGSTASVYRLHLVLDQGKLPKHLRPQSAEATFLEKEHTAKRITHAGKKGEQFLVKVEAFSLGFATDPVLRIFKPDGALLRETDDVKPTRDAEYLWKVSADGDYEIEVADRFGRAGDEIGYRLTVAPPAPDFMATADKHTYTVKAGESTEVKIKITRVHGHAEKLSLKVPEIAGVTFEVPEIPEKSGDVTVKMTAGKEAGGFSGPVQFQILEGEKARTIPFSFQDSAARGPFLLDEIEDLWLTVIAGKPEEKAEKEDK